MYCTGESPNVPIVSAVELIAHFVALSPEHVVSTPAVELPADDLARLLSLPDDRADDITAPADGTDTEAATP